MSIHSSLKSTSTMKRHRSVLSRLERVKILHERGALSLEESTCLGLPKVKHLRFRVKKEKAAAAAATGEAGAAPSAAGAAPAGSTAPAGKTAPAGGKAAPKGAPAAKPEGGAQSKKKE